MRRIVLCDFDLLGLSASKPASERMAADLDVVRDASLACGDDVTSMLRILLDTAMALGRRPLSRAMLVGTSVQD